MNPGGHVRLMSFGSLLDRVREMESRQQLQLSSTGSVRQTVFYNGCPAELCSLQCSDCRFAPPPLSRPHGSRSVEGYLGRFHRTHPNFLPQPLPSLRPPSYPSHDPAFLRQLPSPFPASSSLRRRNLHSGSVSPPFPRPRLSSSLHISSPSSISPVTSQSSSFDLSSPLPLSSGDGCDDLMDMDDEDEVISFEVTPSTRSSRHGRSYLYTSPDAPQIPLLKKDKNVRFAIQFRHNSRYVALCRRAVFQSPGGISEMKRGCLYLRMDRMEYRTTTDRHHEWMTVNRQCWTVLQVTNPVLEELNSNSGVGRRMLLSFELRFPNSQRRMNVKTNKNIFRFQMSMLALCGRRSVMKTRVSFVYRIDSNGKREKLAVDCIRVCRARDGRLRGEVEQHSGPILTPKHSLLCHSRFTPTSVEGNLS